MWRLCMYASVCVCICCSSCSTLEKHRATPFSIIYTENVIKTCKGLPDLNFKFTAWLAVLTTHTWTWTEEPTNSVRRPHFGCICWTHNTRVLLVLSDCIKVSPSYGVYVAQYGRVHVWFLTSLNLLFRAFVYHFNIIWIISICKNYNLILCVEWPRPFFG